ncbi:3-oxo-isoapionate kinase OiaK [Pseudaquabacterium rugosum]|uniref:3-oxo-isoapionate kinase OiaK n=1 Tax=Pseudaquabacterium rugosum TaxID=2984194 RepID=A0ABU9BE03_9BURK
MAHPTSSPSAGISCDPAPGQHPADAWPDGPLLAWCGDDFTGSTDVMEAFARAGVPCVLFLAPPEPHWVQRFAGQRAIGLATTARGRDPAWMDTHLPEAYARLQAFGAPILQYKVCSTFDSAPHVGSIGRAAELGQAAVGGDWVPVVVGAPRLKRYQAFGNLFAVANGQGHRLDRHPTMARHPVTPMDEADLGRHLARQTAAPVALIDLAQLQAGQGAARRDALRDAATAPRVLIDVIDEATLAAAGALVWRGRGQGLFCAASSGLQDALAAHWRRCGLLAAAQPLPRAPAVEAIAAVSGSCSPVTAAQIARAAEDGFTLLRMDLPAALDGAGTAEVERLVTAAAQALAAGRSPLVHSATGPDDPAVTGFDAIARAAGLGRAAAAERVGQRLADVMRGLLDRTPALRRIAIAGGDSSGAVAGSLGIAALSVSAGLVPGAPLCRGWSDEPRRDGLELVLKGGQMGGVDFFGQVRSGGH